MHSQRPWARASGEPCIVIYNAASSIDPGRVIRRARFQHIVHDLHHIALAINAFQLM